MFFYLKSINKKLFLCAILTVGAFVSGLKAQTELFDVTDYTAELAPDLTNKSVKGQVLVRFRALTNDLKEITLNAGALEIDAVRENSAGLRFEKKDDLLKIEFAGPLKNGEARAVEIVYHGTPKYGISFFPDKNQVYTVFSTSQWMPCVDAPADRAAFSLNLITPKNVKTAANGRLIGETPLPDGKISSRWEEKNPVPTYLFGFAFGEFKDLSQKRGAVTFRYLADKSISDDDLIKVFRETADMLGFFESKAGVKYPLKTYTQILPAGDAEQELDGFTLLTADYGRDVLKNEKDIWLGTHEFAHQWWGNMVTNRDWTHFWLNEGIANFMTAAYFEHRFGRAEYLSEIERYKTSYEKVRAAGHDKSLVFAAWRKPSRDDRRLVYDKGAYVVHLLRAELGEKTFWRGIKGYTRKNWGKPVETKDFQKAMETASGRNLSKFFDQWVYLTSK